jgi:capsular polysaccharide biosynthesis protein
VNLKDFVGEVRRYWATAAAVAAAVLVVGWTTILLTPVQYVSSTQLLVSIDGSTTADAYQNDEVVARRVNSYIGLLTTDVVAQRVIDKLGLPVSSTDLADRISATNVPPKTAIIEVAVTDQSPTSAQRIARTLAQEFIGYTDALERPTGEDAQKVHTRVVTNATEPRARNAERLTLALLTVAAAAVLASVAVWIRARTDPVLRSVEQATADGFTVLGTVTGAPGTEADRLDQSLRLQSRLRSLTSSRDGPGRVIVLASAADEHDIVTVATELGRAFESTGGRSIVLDVCNPPSGADDDASAVDATSTADGKPEPDAALPKTVSMSAWIANPDQLATTATAEFLDGLRSDFDYVLIAAPPILSAATAAVLGQHADTVALVASPGHTKRRDVAQASDDLRATGAPLIAVLFSQILTQRTHSSDPESQKRLFTLLKVGATGSIGVTLGVSAFGLWQICRRLLHL